ncbi:hypothetical protein C6496_13880 [Candidatus Poribacteria bacterium]|nr:MAG: hypothetical protein C6496_13880 [Candidatus Poribacteria bacterium]
MFSKKQIAIFVLVFSFMIMLGVGLYAHRMHDVKKIDLSFTSLPEITCNIDGDTFTHTRATDANGNIQQDWWHKTPTDPKVTIEAKSHGFGYAHILLYGNIYGKPKGDANNTTPQQLGSWIGFLPLGYGAPEETIEVSFGAPFNYSKGEYSWNASGSVKLVPYYWKWGLSGIIPSGSWEPAPSDFHNTQDATGSTSGSWAVEHNYSEETTKRVPVDGSDSTDTTDTTTTDTTTSTTDSDDDSGSSQSDNLYSSDGSYTLYAGDTHNATCVTAKPYRSVAWYVDDFLWETDDNPDGTATEASFSHTFNEPGTYTIKAEISILNGGNSTESYTITVQ